MVFTVVRPFYCPTDFNSLNNIMETDKSPYQHPLRHPKWRMLGCRISGRKRWKVANAIAGYHTAISEIHELVDGQSVGSHPDISRAILAVHRLNLPVVKQNDNLDISSSLEYILSLGDNNSMSFHQLTIKTIFLVALVMASHPSDIVRMDLMTLQATDNSYSFDCVALKEYNIASVHSTAMTKLKQSISGQHQSKNDRLSDSMEKREWLTKPAIDTIAGWIKSVIQISSPASTTKDVHATSASLAQNAGMDLSTILALGNWTIARDYICPEVMRLI
ncbi:hypothetical protein C1646_762386 [Rhizophagus diaphanus]|nr:hypothetical protein C1646_762386 [Rhizophagus diaphanus] [Rhizophagus sp. MUCL 43196]